MIKFEFYHMHEIRQFLMRIHITIKNQHCKSTIGFIPGIYYPDMYTINSSKNPLKEQNFIKLARKNLFLINK